MPRDISWAQTLGSATLTAFIVQALTGVILAMYYKPRSRATAYASIQNITNELTLGWLVRGMHRGARASSSSCSSSTWARVFLFGAYKYPRELNWIIGVLLLVLGMLEGFTGYLLPWDQTAYWATVVGINLNGTAPFARAVPRAVPRGRARDRRRTRSRSSTRCTCCCVPGAIIALIGLHLYLVVRLGVTSPPWSSEAAGARAAGGGSRSRRADRASPPREGGEA